MLPFPGGNDFDPNKANAEDSGFRGPTAVDSYPAGASPFGVFDRAGNEWEGVADSPLCEIADGFRCIADNIFTTTPM